jgi:hypothetical protein
MIVNYIDAIISWLRDNYVFLTLMGLGIWYGKLAFKELIFTPLAGGNGKVQMDELAKGIVLVVLILASYKDGTRTHEWQYFSDSFYAILLAAVCGIASIKPAAQVLNNYFTKKDNNGKID